MTKNTFGIIAAACMTSFLSAQVSAQDATKDQKPKGENKDTKPEMVRCYSNTCAGKFEYKGKQNSCDTPNDAMEVPKSVCDPKKGFKIAPK